MANLGSQQNFMQIPAKNFVLEQGTVFPTSPAPVKGQLFYRTDLDQEYICTNATGPVWSTSTIPDATTAVKGKVQLATTGEAVTGSDTTKAMTPAGVVASINQQVPNASTGTPGKVQLATTAEVTAGTSSVKAVTPAGLQSKIDALVAAAPGLLDTLDEIAAALGDDPNFAATITTALAGKASTGHTHDLTTSSITGVLPLAKGGTGIDGTGGTYLIRNAINAVGGQTIASPALTAGTWVGITMQDANHQSGLPKRRILAFYDATTGEEVKLDTRYDNANQYSVRTDVVGGYAAGALNVVQLG